MNEEDFEKNDWRWRVFDSLSFPTLILTPEKVIVTANQKFFDKFGVEMKDIVGKTCHEIFYQIRSTVFFERLPAAEGPSQPGRALHSPSG